MRFIYFYFFVRLDFVKISGFHLGRFSLKLRLHVGNAIRIGSSTIRGIRGTLEILLELDLPLLEEKKVDLWQHHV